MRADLRRMLAEQGVEDVLRALRCELETMLGERKPAERMTREYFVTLLAQRGIEKALQVRGEQAPFWF